MDMAINLTQEELQLIYTACMNYGNRLEEIIKDIPNEEEIIRDELAKNAKKHWKLARKITDYMEDTDDV